jgi:hypothetical protein
VLRLGDALPATDRGKAGGKLHLVVEAHGIPLAAITTGGHRNDVTPQVPRPSAVGHRARKQFQRR